MIEETTTTVTKTSKRDKVLIVIMAAFILSICGLFYVMLNYETWRTFELTSEETCKKELPNGYTLAYNESTKKYAVKIGYEYIHFIKFYGKSSIVFSSFRDSCIAKAFCFAYLEDIQEEAQRNNFK